MSGLENANAPVPPQLRTWDFMETLFVGLIAYGVFALSGGLTLTILLASQDGADKLSPGQLDAFAMQGRWVGAALVVASPLTIGVLWIAIRKAGRGFAEYLALNWPGARELVRALMIIAIVRIVSAAIGGVVGVENPGANPYLLVRGAGGLFILLVGGCIAGPIMEEFVYRGFLFRGWSQSFVGPIGAIVLTATAFALTHTQYDWFGRLIIFVDGLVLGHFRWRSNSTWLTVIVHSTTNISIFFTMGPYV